MNNETDTEQETTNGNGKSPFSDGPTAAKPTTVLMHRRSSGHGHSLDHGRLAVRSDDPELREHLKHLGPSNAATRPKSTRIPTVKIKPGIPNMIPENTQRPSDGAVIMPSHAPQGGVGEGILESAGREASDGAHSVAVGYGTMQSDRMSWKSGNSRLKTKDEDDALQSPKFTGGENADTQIIIDNRGDESRTGKSQESEETPQPIRRTKSASTIASLRSIRSYSKTPPKKRHTARSGSISENVFDVNGVRKIVLETTSSSDSEDKALRAQTNDAQDRDRLTSSHSESQSTETGAQAGGKKKRKKRPKKKKNGGSNSGESQPLLGGEQG